MTANKVCGKGKCKFTDEFCASGDCPYDPDMLKNSENFNILEGNVKEDDINVANNVAQRISQDLERVADTSKTINHIADVSKKVSLTEQWKRGELKTGWYYVSRNKDIEMLEYVGDYFLSGDVPLIDDKDVSTLEVLAPVPSYGDCLINEALIKDLSKKVNKLIEENQRFKSLLKECKTPVNLLIKMNIDGINGYKLLDLLTKIDEVLK